MSKYTFFLITMLCFISADLLGQYKGTAAVTQGKANTTTTNLYSCTGGRISGLGTITATDNSVWTVPADVNFTNTAFPFSSDLHNACIGANYANATAALAALNGSDIVNIDSDGEVITAYLFADNYFEMYINGVAVGKDKVPFTQFNSSIVRFKVKKPFTIAIQLVDWEENLGLGSELNGGFAYHDVDGGMVAVFKDNTNKIIAITDKNWKAQTFYTSPITDLNCLKEIGTQRLSSDCSTQDSNDGTKYYALHWKKPSNWMMPSFDDSSWPNASTYSNATIGVNNKPAYTNFTDIFDNATADAQFIWSTNVILDNEVVVRYTVGGTTATNYLQLEENLVNVYPNPANDIIHIDYNESFDHEVQQIEIQNIIGKTVFFSTQKQSKIDIQNFPKGIYFLNLSCNNGILSKKIIIQ